MPATVLSTDAVEALDHHESNLIAWQAILDDPVYQSLPHRVESNRFGQALMSPPPAPEHGEEQSNLVLLLDQHAPSGGRVISECPISTSEGVRAADVAWISLERRRQTTGKPFLTLAPEICVEILSPSNRRDEMALKKALYFEAGAEEVWFRELSGEMRFFTKNAPEDASESVLCPAFPKHVSVSP